MGSLSAHRSMRVGELIEARGCELWYLSVYSPELLPIVEVFSKTKPPLRKFEARNSAALERSNAAASVEVTASGTTVEVA